MPYMLPVPPNDIKPLNATSKDLTISQRVLPRTPLSPPWYYQVAIAILKPLYRLQVWRRSRSRDNYQQEVDQRFGRQYPIVPHTQAMTSQQPQKIIWCHAVSLGETNTVAPVLDALMAKGYAIWLTNTTQTGFARGAIRFANDIEQGRLSHSYVPVDSPKVIDRFLIHVQPIAALFVETELWATILNQLSERNIPSILVNGRLSASSFQRYQKIGAVSASMMQNLTLIIAQDKESAKRFRQLGAYSAQIRVAGSLKWVINTPQLNASNHDVSQKVCTDTDDDRKSLPTLLSNYKNAEPWHRPIWVAASTHEGEESTALAWQQLLLAKPKLVDTLLILVPRHPERFDEVADLIQATGLTMARRSLNEPITEHTQVYLADSMGELMRWYKRADVALVGGSLVDIGGHNPVEPASVATPIVMGEYTQSCQEVVDQLAEVGALYQPYNEFCQCSGDDLQLLKATQKSSKKFQAIHANELIYQQLEFWLSHLLVAKSAGQAGAQLTTEQQRVLTRQLTMIEETIEQATPSVIYE